MKKVHNIVSLKMPINSENGKCILQSRILKRQQASMIRFCFILFIVAVSAGISPPEKCCENSHWNDCGNPCSEPSCDNIHGEQKFCPLNCVQQCSCNDGYVKGPNGDCILPRECPKTHNCTGPYEFWNKCGSDCEKECIKPKEPISCPAVCVEKCSCLKGYLRGPDGKCVAEKDCPLPHICLDDNAVWSDCASGCDQHYCGESDEPKSCTQECLQQCTCKPGYYLRADGRCVLKKDCPKKCKGKNEVWNDCGSPCEKECTKPKEPMMCADVCVAKCTCAKGHVRGPSGDCIAEEDCPVEHTCSDKNAEWNECANCNQRSCGQGDGPHSCPAHCVAGCACKSGYVKGPDGNCILEKNCPHEHECKGENECWDECGSNCEEECEEPKDPKGCAAVCVAKCSCIKGYVRGPHGKCIAKEDCPKKKCSDPNAEWNKCANCNQRSCGESDEKKFCPAHCEEGCVCKSGYVKGPDGNCILEKNCPHEHECEGENECWDECGSNCEEQCEKPKDPKACTDVCVAKCSCIKGYVRGPHGKCIPKKDCPKNKCTDPNAFWNECAKPCPQPTCDNKTEETTACASTLCRKECTCKPGYVIGPDGKCILKEHCPPRCSDPNEIFTHCGPTDSCEKGCETPEPGRACLAICLSKCVCKPGLVRGPRGKCIKKEDCPQKCLRPNQFWNECGNACEPRCDKSHLRMSCAAVCVKKCSCKRGYFIANNGDCVKEEDCDYCE